MGNKPPKRSASTGVIRQSTVPNVKAQNSEVSERARILNSIFVPGRELPPKEGPHSRGYSEVPLVKDKLDYQEFAEIIKKRNLPPQTKNDPHPTNMIANPGSRSNLDSLHQKPEEYDAFFMAVDRQENLLGTLKEGVVVDDQDYLIQELVANKTLFHTIYHYKFHEGLIENRDIVSALILPADDRLFDQRINMLELKELLQTIGKEKAVVRVTRTSPSLLNILKPQSKQTTLDKQVNRDSIKINVNNLVDPLEDQSPGMADLANEKIYTKKFLDSKIGKILVKGADTLEANEEQAMKTSILHSLRDLNSKSLVIHDRSYDMNADVSHIKQQPLQDSSEEFKGEQVRSFLFEFQKNVKMNVEGVKNTMKKLVSQSLKDNFEIKTRTIAGRVNFYITKRKVQNNLDSGTDLDPKESANLFLSVPELLSIEYRLIDELKFKFTKAYYFEIKDMEEAYFYFRVESNVSAKK